MYMRCDRMWAGWEFLKEADPGKNLQLETNCKAKTHEKATKTITFSQ